MNITPNFAWEELSVSASHPDLCEPVPENLKPNAERLCKTILQPIREWWGKSMHLDSCYRPEALNKAVGGSPTSQHRYAQAADVTTDGTRTLFKKLLENPAKFPLGQVIYYPAQNFIHMALPSEKYPKPRFFVSKIKKVYTTCSSVSALNALCPE